MNPPYLDHFLQLEKRNAKGYTTFRCLSCQHTFRCSGKRRLIQHIIGKDYCLGKDRNIIPCPNPNPTIKAKLLEDISRMRKSDDFVSFVSPSSSAPSSPKSSPFNLPQASGSSNFSCQTSTWSQGNVLETQLQDLTSLENLKEEIEKFDSLEENSDFDSEFVNLIDVLFQENKPSPGTEKLPQEKKGLSLSNDQNPTGILTGNYSHQTFQVSSSTQSPQSPFEFQRRKLNSAIIKFFSAYGIPLNAVEHPTFLTFYQQIPYLDNPELHYF